ncbi:N-acetylmuramoyl-L-alanine amidase [Ammoniphilus resinae]|uniref:MurNAc-LAA domain-containing protein n=1 Tax=Ammoniphilus resinae TaxID=861532 RepID=A0ABS4GRQ3_9BACL|nr:N-acetylmuramoyl-L-alanine amidase [Ammoniphilus resinae]MBP1932955.1 hypothetical protein [Ammoniphilus resinae]
MTLIVLDPGHGGKDSGATGFGLVEKDLALVIASLVQRLFKEQYVVDVRMTRETDVFIPLSERANLANQWKADLFIAFHHNASGGEGFESYIYPSARGTKVEEIQNKLHDTMMSYMKNYGVKDRGKKQANFAVVRETRMPAILLENLFVDNAHDASLLKQQSFLQGLAQSVVNGVALAIQLIPRPSQQPIPVAPTAPAAPPTAPPSSPHWAKPAHDALRAAGFLLSDHTANLDQPASEGMVITLFNRLREALNIQQAQTTPAPPNNSPNEHWAALANDELMKARILQSDHRGHLDEPASEAMVIEVANRIWQAAKK